MITSEVWDDETAASYRADNADMFSSATLDPVLDVLTDLVTDGYALEFAIGTGRVALPLRERGVPVAGIELSPAMLAQLRLSCDAVDLPVVLGDISEATATVPDAHRGPEGSGQFDLVYLVYNTVMNLLTQDAQVRCFANAARHLRPGGHFLVECMVPTLRSLPPGQLAYPFEVTRRHLGFDTYDLVAQQLVSHHFRAEPDGRYRRFESRHRFVWPSELDLMARLAGLRLVRRTADWAGAPFADDSPAHVSVWQL